MSTITDVIRLEISVTGTAALFGSTADFQKEYESRIVILVGIIREESHILSIGEEGLSANRGDVLGPRAEKEFGDLKEWLRTQHTTFDDLEDPRR